MKIEFEKFKDLNKDVRSFPLVVLGISLVLMVAAFFGYLMFIQGDMGQPSVQNNVSEMSGNQAKESDVAVKEETGTADTASLDGAIQEVQAASGEVKIVANKDKTVFEVWNLGVKAGEIKQDYPAQVSIWREVNGNIYLGVSYTGRGGYILFSGPDEVYKLETIENSLNKIYGRGEKNGYASDISLDEKRLITVESPVSGNLSIVVYDIATQSAQSYPVSAKYGTAGAAHFSQVGGKIVYEAAIGISNNEKYTEEEYAMFMIDLATGKQTQIGGAEAPRS